MQLESRDNRKNLLIGLLAIVTLLTLLRYQRLESEKEVLQQNIEEYSAALDEANSNIEDAKGYIGASAQEKEYALQNLEVVAKPW